LRRATELYRVSGEETPPEDRAFIAMASWRLGEKEAARREMRILQGLVAAGEGSAASHSRAIVHPWACFYEEAAALIGTAPSG
jgi:hypothetical protein